MCVLCHQSTKGVWCVCVLGGRVTRGDREVWEAAGACSGGQGRAGKHGRTRVSEEEVGREQGRARKRGGDRRCQTVIKPCTRIRCLIAVRAVHRLNLPYTGANLPFYEPSKIEMKMAAQYYGVQVRHTVLRVLLWVWARLCGWVRQRADVRQRGGTARVLGGGLLQLGGACAATSNTRACV